MYHEYITWSRRRHVLYPGQGGEIKGNDGNARDNVMHERTW